MKKDGTTNTAKAEETMKKLRALANDVRGNENERAMAQNRLRRLMEKYNITEDDLEYDEQKRRDFHFFEDWEHKLICQTIYKICGDRPIYRQANKKKWIWCELTDAEFLEFELHYWAYHASFLKELDLFYLGFISKNDIYPHPSLVKEKDNNEPSKYSRADRIRAGMMAEGIERTQIRRSLTNGTNE